MDKNRWLKFSSVQGGFGVLGKTHMCSTSSFRISPSITFEILMMALSHPFQEGQWLCVCVRVCVCACVRACVRACVCVCVHVYLFTVEKMMYRELYQIAVSLFRWLGVCTCSTAQDRP